MATTEQLKSRVNLLQKSGEYYAPEDFMTVWRQLSWPVWRQLGWPVRFLTPA